MLTRAQQNTRIVSQTANNYTMTNAATVTYRGMIRNPASIPPGAIIFGCDYAANASAGNGTFNASGDGEWTAANHLSWMDQAAYADWAALRPMTELEFEKACRGPSPSLYNEYAWGTTSITAATGINNSGTANETASNSGANCVYGNSGTAGPLRCGFAVSSSRSLSGSSYYGVRELSGNLWERPVTIGNADGRNFTGLHGNGALDTDETPMLLTGRAQLLPARAFAAAVGTMMRGTLVCPTATSPLARTRIVAAVSARVAQGLPPELRFALLEF